MGKLTEADYNNIDCLMCHAPSYRRTVVRDGDQFKVAPAQDVDILRAAQNVQKPTTEMCLRCHAGAGGGPNHKHGVTPTVDSDVHLAKAIQCVRCHTTRKHQVAGGADLKAQELLDVKVTCATCHTVSPHQGASAPYLNKHIDRIACQTCHIPAIARDRKMPTVMERDWTKPVLNQTSGLYVPTNTFATNVKPEYRWWSRIMEVPPEPVGSIQDPQSKIYPWKRTKYTVIADAATGQAIYIKAGVYSVTGDVGAAAKRGADDAKQSYSGRWKGVEETMVFSLNHQVAPKPASLQCNDCHSPTGVMDFKTLGYSEEQAKDLTRGR